MQQQITPNIVQSNVFIFQSTELEGRLDPFYYIPELVELDRKIKTKTKHRLRDFRIFRASGATPSKTDESLYSDAENGIPFIRVQNLSTTGELDLTDLVYIAKSTHEGMLKRSKIQEFDLLVKITGVGRMAVASVVPEGFEGNINQHIVVVRTGSRQISENLAAYLNLDFVEKLATKRSTGGTRPALDYPALFSIPVINERKVFKIIQQAVKEKKKKEARAQRLLDSIDEYLLGELGVNLPESLNKKLENRIYIKNHSHVAGRRIDPNYNMKIDLILNQEVTYPYVNLRDIITKPPQYGANEEAIEVVHNDYTRYIRITDIDVLGNLKDHSIKTAAITNNRYLLNKNDLLFARSGSVGRAYLHKETSIPAIFAGYLIRFVLNTNKADPNYIFYYCHSSIYKLWVNAIYRPAVQANINSEEYKSLPISLPPLRKQREISETIDSMRDEAFSWRAQAHADLEVAKRQAETIILGDA